MLIHETLISPRGVEVSRTKEIPGTINQHIIDLDREGWKIVKIQVMEGGVENRDGRQDPGGDGTIS